MCVTLSPVNQTVTSYNICKPVAWKPQEERRIRKLTMSTNHILHSRYNYLLSPLRSFDHTSETLCEKGFISSGERAEIQAILTEEEKRSTLCDILSAKGAASLVEVSEVLTLEHQKQSVEARNGFNVVTSSSSSSSSSSTGTAVSGGGDGRSFEGREYGGRWGEEQRTSESAWRHQGDDAKHQQGILAKEYM